MKSGKMLLMVIIVLASAASIATFQGFIFDENDTTNTDDFSSNAKTVRISLSDGVGSKLSGIR
jgi:hypothetical protein